MIVKFASHYLHNKLYKAYDQCPELWKPSLWDFCINRPLWIDGYADDWTEDQWDDHIAKTTNRINQIEYPFDTENCDYWLGQRFRKAMRYTRYSACQWMSRANYLMACKVMPNHSWFHVADDDINEGKTHHYVINDKGEVLDPQGLALNFDLAQYQKTFKPEMVTSHEDVIERLEELSIEYQLELNGVAFSRTPVTL